MNLLYIKNVVNKLTIKTALIAGSLFISAYVNAQTNDLQSRLDTLAAELEKQRIEQHIPGMAIAIVKDNKVIYQQGFGVSNIEKNILVTPQTTFAIGSTSKAFTATLVGMMIDKGTMTWDDQANKYIPYYQFKKDGEPLELTMRDMLSHRSGYSRNDILWVNGKVASQDILKDATKAEAWAPFRKQFHYNNVMYLAAGVASAKVNKTSWNEMLNTQLLKPLGMSNTTADFEQAQQSGLLSLGYMWREEAQEFKQLPMRNLGNIGPAGAINSNVVDMANWLKLQLNKGKFQGKQLVSAQQIQATHTPQIKIADNIHYGLGWFLRQWQGQAVVEHGGNTDGFGAQVALYPESNLGFVLLTNVTATPLQQLSINMVAEHLLGSPSEKKDQQTANNDVSYSPYIGEYVGNFGPFKNAIFKTLIKDGKPAVDVPGQTVYTLKSPNEQGKWLFDLTDTIAISFERNQQGQVSAMRLHQNGMDFELPKKGVVIAPEISPDELQKYLGNYYSKHLKSETKAIIQNHRLALDVPKQMVYELHLPDEEGKWKFRINPNMHATFDYDKNNAVSTLNFFKDGKATGKMPRVQGANDTTLPTVADILALRKTKATRQALDNAQGIQVQGTVFFAQAGISGTLDSYSLTDTHARFDLDLGKYGYIQTAINPDSAAILQSFSPFEQMEGKYLKQAQKSFPMLDLDWSTFYQNIEVLKRSKLGDKDVYMVLLKNEALPTVTAYVDAENGDVLKHEASMMLPVIGAMPYTVVFEDYKDVDGIRFPFKVISKDGQRGRIVLKYTSVETGLNLDKNLFTLSPTDTNKTKR